MGGEASGSAAVDSEASGSGEAVVESAELGFGSSGLARIAALAAEVGLEAGQRAEGQRAAKVSVSVRQRAYAWERFFMPHANGGDEGEGV